MSLFKKVLDYIQTYKIFYKYKAINLSYYSLNISVNIIYSLTYQIIRDYIKTKSFF